MNYNRPIPNPQFPMEANNLKLASVLLIVTLAFLTPSIQEALSGEVANYVNDSESAHHGLPTEWEEKQVICVFFPSDYTHNEFYLGVTMIDSDGSVLGVNEELGDLAGACVGGIDGYDEGMAFMMDSTRIAGGRLAVGYELGEWGPFVHTIGGLNADEVRGEFGGAYWSLSHNDVESMVGSGDLVMSEGDVLSWSIMTW